MGMGICREDLWYVKGYGGVYGSSKQHYRQGLRGKQADQAVSLQVVTLDAQKLRLGIDFNTPTSGLNKVEEFMRRQAEGLLLELDVWCNSLSSSAQHSRVTVSDEGDSD
jgi:hypothetical protein